MKQLIMRDRQKNEKEYTGGPDIKKNDLNELVYLDMGTKCLHFRCTEYIIHGNNCSNLYLKKFTAYKPSHTKLYC